MQDSTDTRITYVSILERAEQCARDAMPDFPKKDSQELWESYIANLESIDSYEVAHESGEWDWAIYYHRAMELCQAVPNGILSQAEDEAYEVYDFDRHSKNFGLYEMAVLLATQIVTREIVDAIEQVREELLELASDKLDQLTSDSEGESV